MCAESASTRERVGGREEGREGRDRGERKTERASALAGKESEKRERGRKQLLIFVAAAEHYSLVAASTTV